MPLASKSTENMLDLLPLPGFRPISLSIHNSDFDEDRAKRAMEACKFVHTASVDSREKIATAVVDLGAVLSPELAVQYLITALDNAGITAEELVYEKKAKTYDVSEMLIFAAVGAATGGVAYAYLASRVDLGV